MTRKLPVSSRMKFFKFTELWKNAQGEESKKSINKTRTTKIKSAKWSNRKKKNVVDYINRMDPDRLPAQIRQYKLERKKSCKAK